MHSDRRVSTGNAVSWRHGLGQRGHQTTEGRGMFAKRLRLREMVPSSVRSRRARLRGAGLALAAAIVAGACGTAMTIPTGTGPSNSLWSSYSPFATNSPWSTNSPTQAPSPSAWGSPSDLATQSPSPVGTAASFDSVMGHAALAAPAADYGAVAGGQIDDFGFDLLRPGARGARGGRLSRLGGHRCLGRRHRAPIAHPDAGLRGASRKWPASSCGGSAVGEEP